MWVAIVVATVGKTLGGVLNYWFGLGTHELLARGRQTRYLHWLEQLRAEAALFPFLPVVGDPLCALAGWLKLPFRPCALWTALGKLLRCKRSAILSITHKSRADSSAENHVGATCHAR